MGVYTALRRPRHIDTSTPNDKLNEVQFDREGGSMRGKTAKKASSFDLVRALLILTAMWLVIALMGLLREILLPEIAITPNVGLWGVYGAVVTSLLAMLLREPKSNR